MRIDADILTECENSINDIEKLILSSFQPSQERALVLAGLAVAHVKSKAVRFLLERNREFPGFPAIVEQDAVSLINDIVNLAKLNHGDTIDLANLDRQFDDLDVVLDFLRNHIMEYEGI